MKERYVCPYCWRTEDSEMSIKEHMKSCEWSFKEVVKGSNFVLKENSFGYIIIEKINNKRERIELDKYKLEELMNIIKAYFIGEEK